MPQSTPSEGEVGWYRGSHGPERAVFSGGQWHSAYGDGSLGDPLPRSQGVSRSEAEVRGGRPRRARGKVTGSTHAARTAPRENPTDVDEAAYEYMTAAPESHELLTRAAHTSPFAALGLVRQAIEWAQADYRRLFGSEDVPAWVDGPVSSAAIFQMVREELDQFPSEEGRQNPKKPQDPEWTVQIYTAPGVIHEGHSWRARGATALVAALRVFDDTGLFPSEIHHVEVWRPGEDPVEITAGMLERRQNPASVVKTKGQEKLWGEAKQASIDTYGEIRWPVVMHVFKRKRAAHPRANPDAAATESLKEIFEVERDRFGLTDVALGVEDRPRKTHRDCARAQIDTRTVWFCKTALVLLAPENMVALCRHELAHLVDPDCSEAETDLIAEEMGGDEINYDERGIQTIGPGTRPRPKHLPR